MSSEVVSGKNIAVDLDNTWCRSEVAFACWYLKNYKIDLLSLSASQTWEYVRKLGFGNQETQKMISAFKSSQEFADAPAFPDSNVILTKLSMASNRLSFITSRPFPRDISISWITKNLPGVLFPDYNGHFPLYKAFSYDMPNPDDLTKGEICQMKMVDVIVENSLEHAEDCLKYNIRVVLFDDEGQYIGHKLPQGTERVSSWKEVPGALSRSLAI